MLETLHRIVQEVNAAASLEQALAIIVSRVKQAMAVDVCSVYLTDETARKHVLMATDGLRPESVSMVKLDMGKGLISLVYESAEPINLENAPDHPRYQYIPETGEERYHGFLGVPIIHHRKMKGVLVVQLRGARRFADDEVSFLVTIAAQLSGAIAHAQASGEITQLEVSSQQSSQPFNGQPGSPGVAIGQAVVFYPAADVEAIPDRKIDDVEAEIELFKNAVKAARYDIQTLVERMHSVSTMEDTTLFDAYLLMLDSESFNGKVIAEIGQGNWAPGALRITVLEHIRFFNAMEDPYLRERAEDIRDLGRRILSHLHQTKDKTEFPAGTILVGEEITATMLAEIPPGQLAGVIAVRGSRTSHVAILARSLGIPAVLGVRDLPVNRLDGREVVVDGYTGRVYVSPARAIVSEFKRLARDEELLSAELKQLRDQPSVTPDGEAVPLLANMGLLADISSSLSFGAEGIGLYRTEFPFMARDRFPGEEEQYQVYRQILESFHPRPVTLRTLDVGGDKSLPYFPIHEDNPFLGWRGIRISLDHPEIFMVQIRAMLRASAGLANLSILLPMVTSVSEVDEALHIIRRAHHELMDSDKTIVMPRIGVMIEVPSALYQLPALARRVDFFSIGTNDLTQYLLAVDRNNDRVAELYDSLHPAVVSALNTMIATANQLDKPVSICGEMAGDPAAVILLLGMGIQSLSMTAASIAAVKWVVRSFTREQCAQIVNKVLALESPYAIRQLLNQALENAGLGGLVRAGR